MDPSNIISFLSFRVIFHFHVYGRKGATYMLHGFQTRISYNIRTSWPQARARKRTRKEQPGSLFSLLIGTLPPPPTRDASETWIWTVILAGPTNWSSSSELQNCGTISIQWPRERFISGLFRGSLDPSSSSVFWGETPGNPLANYERNAFKKPVGRGYVPRCGETTLEPSSFFWKKKCTSPRLPHGLSYVCHVIPPFFPRYDFSVKKRLSTNRSRRAACCRLKLSVVRDSNLICKSWGNRHPVVRDSNLICKSWGNRHPGKIATGG